MVDGVRERGQWAGKILLAATGKKYWNAFGGIAQRESGRRPHLLKRLHREVCPNGELPGLSVTPKLEDERSAGRRVIAPPIGDPGQVQQSRNIGYICVVADQKERTISWFARDSVNYLLGNRPFDRLIDYVQQVRGCDLGKGGCSFRKVSGC